MNLYLTIVLILARRCRRFLVSAGFVLLPFLPILPSDAATVILSYTNSPPNPMTWQDNYAEASPYPSSNMVAGVPGTLQKVTVTINGLSDGSTPGINLVLQGPGASPQAVNLLGGDGLYGDPVTNLNITFDDASPNTMSSSAPLVSGTNQPSGAPLPFDDTQLGSMATTNKLAGFIGTPLNGTWSLYEYYDDFDRPYFGAITNWVLNFYVQMNPPTVTTLAATNISATSATLNASVNAGGGYTTVYFEWGPTTAYGNITASELLTNNLSATQIASVIATGLPPGTTNHFQALAANGAGTNYGGDLTFVTPAAQALPPVLTVSLPSARAPVLTLSGTVGSNYNVLYTTNLNPPVTWTVLTSLTLTNTSQNISPGPATNRNEFFEAVQVAALPAQPVLTVTENGSQSPFLTISGTVGANYNVFYATNLVPPVTWTLFTNLTLTNVSENISLGTINNQAEFFEAVVP